MRRCAAVCETKENAEGVVVNKYKSFAKAAQKRRIKFRTCDRKAAHSREQAVTLAEKLKQRVYECPYCHKWHLTKKKDVM